MRQQQEEAILSERVIINGVTTPLTLTADGRLTWSEVEGIQRHLIVEKEVLGFTTEGPRVKVKAAVDRSDAACCLGPTSGRFGGGLVRRIDFVFEPLTVESKRAWSQNLTEYIDSLGRPKKLFVFVNPFGGKKSGRKLFLEDVKPFLEDADIQYSLQETKYQLHAKEVVNSLDLDNYDAIICVSGDGTLVEIVNGLLQRDDWSTAIKMPIGIVPAGTGNGMVKSLLDSVGLPCTPSHATMAIIRGHKRSLDVATIKQGETKFFSVLMLAWGLIADIDIESEKYRWMGKARIEFYALQRVIRLRYYTGRISFVPAPGFEQYGEPTSYRDTPIPSRQEQAIDSQLRGYQGPHVNLEKLEWRTINGPFVSIWLHNVPWGAENTMAAPDAKFSDGYLDLIMMKDCSKLAMLSCMSEMESGGHVKSPHVTYLKVKAFILEPGACLHDPAREGIIDSDGEVLARGKGTYKCELKTLMSYDTLQITMDQGLATLFTPV
ncbi:hypothetical protein ACFE04_020150 [Oxalis oulophora]